MKTQIKKHEEKSPKKCFMCQRNIKNELYSKKRKLEWEDPLYFCEPCAKNTKFLENTLSVHRKYKRMLSRRAFLK
jgi:hypothetical protein